MNPRLAAVPPQIYKTAKPKLLGMTSPSEQAFLEWYASTAFAGVGAMLDLGSWLGSSTISLARGLALNPQTAATLQTIHAYDLFSWRPTMVTWVKGTKWEGRLKDGDSFLPLFEELIADHPAIKPHAGDLCKMTWAGGPIEFIHVDAMKSWPLAKAIVRNFFTALHPAEGVIVHQDYIHFYESWIHIMQYRLREHFQKVHQVPSSSSVVFALTKPVTPADAARVCDLPDWTDAEMDAAFAWSCEQVSAGHHGHIRSAQAMAYVHRGNTARARELVEQIRRDNLRVDSSLEKILAESAGS